MGKVTKKEYEDIGGKACTFFEAGLKSAAPRYLLIQPTGVHESESLDNEVRLIAKEAGAPFVMAAFHVTDWNGELSCQGDRHTDNFWCEEDGPSVTLKYVLEKLIPYIRTEYELPEDVKIILGGYSLAGLFSLWSAYQTDVFYAVCGCSPSVWFPGWIEYISGREIRCEKIYLSLGRKEPKVRGMMSVVGENIERMAADLSAQDSSECTLVWNNGTHFTEPDRRTAAGFIWSMTDPDRVCEGE